MIYFYLILSLLVCDCMAADPSLGDKQLHKSSSGSKQLREKSNKKLGKNSSCVAKLHTDDGTKPSKRKGKEPASNEDKSQSCSTSLSNSGSDLWERRYSEAESLEIQNKKESKLLGYIKAAESIYGKDPNALKDALYRVEKIEPAQRKKMLQNLGQKKTNLINLAQECLKEGDDGESAARDIMELVGFLEFSIYDYSVFQANGRPLTFRVSPRVFAFWEKVRANEAAAKSAAKSAAEIAAKSAAEADAKAADEAAASAQLVSSEYFKKASELHKKFIKSPRHYEQGKTELLALANEAIDKNEEQAGLAIVRLIGDLECKKQAKQGASGSVTHTPRTKNVIAKLDQTGVKRVSKLDISSLANQI